jgi:nitrous oxidase accessory protein
MALSSIATKIAGAAILAALAASPVGAETVSVPAGGAKSLQNFLDLARPGDVLRLAAGEHRGPVTVSVPVTLEGEPGAKIVGNGAGTVLRVTAPGAIVRGLAVSGSGTDISTLDSGIFLDRSAKGALVEDNEVTGNLYGVYIYGANDAMVRNNRITGISEGRSAQAGNGVHLWNAPGAKVIGNDISKGRDGIYTTASRDNVFSGNRFTDLRFAIHYMYTNNSEISGNVSTGNSVGYAIMFSDRLTITDNISNGDRDHGLLLNTAKGSRVSGNIVIGRMQGAERWLRAGLAGGDSHGVPMGGGEATDNASGMRLGPEKCVFLYNANRNQFSDNWFENCVIGIHFTAGAEGNRVSGNTFVNNRNQVKYVGTRFLDWSDEGRGNFWSDNPAFDLNGDGLGDTPYRPNDLVDRVLWTAPQAKILTNSPAVQVIRWAQSQFPAILPGGVVDSHPLMAPPPLLSESRSRLQ